MVEPLTPEILTQDTISKFSCLCKYQNIIPGNNPADDERLVERLVLSRNEKDQLLKAINGGRVTTDKITLTEGQIKVITSEQIDQELLGPNNLPQVAFIPVARTRSQHLRLLKSYQTLCVISQTRGIGNSGPWSQRTVPEIELSNIPDFRAILNEDIPQSAYQNVGSNIKLPHQRQIILPLTLSDESQAKLSVFIARFQDQEFDQSRISLTYNDIVQAMTTEDQIIFQLAFCATNIAELVGILRYYSPAFGGDLEQGNYHRFLCYLLCDTFTADNATETLENAVDINRRKVDIILRALTYIKDLEEPNKTHSILPAKVIRVIDGMAMLLSPEMYTPDNRLSERGRYGGRATMFARETIRAAYERKVNQQASEKTNAHRLKHYAGKMLYEMAKEKFGQDFQEKVANIANGIKLGMRKAIAQQADFPQEFTSLFESERPSMVNFKEALGLPSRQIASQKRDIFVIKLGLALAQKLVDERSMPEAAMVIDIITKLFRDQTKLVDLRQIDQLRQSIAGKIA